MHSTKRDIDKFIQKFKNFGILRLTSSHMVIIMNKDDGFRHWLQCFTLRADQCSIPQPCTVLKETSILLFKNSRISSLTFKLICLIFDIHCRQDFQLHFCMQHPCSVLTASSQRPRNVHTAPSLRPCSVLTAFSQLPCNQNRRGL